MLTLFANLKGGTGKSTIVFNLAMSRIALGKNVTVCDLDPQRTVSDVALIRKEDGIEPPLNVVHKLPQKAKARGDWLIDVGTSDMDAVRDAIKICSKIVIPVTPSQADIWATQRFLQIVLETCGPKKSPKIMAFINRADTHPKSRENEETMVALLALPKIKALEEKLMQRMAFRRSFSEGMAVFELEPRSKAAAELKALAKAIYK